MQDAPNTLPHRLVSLPPPWHALHEEALVAMFCCDQTFIQLHTWEINTLRAMNSRSPHECALNHPRRAIRQSVNVTWGQNRTWGRWAAL